MSEAEITTADMMSMIRQRHPVDVRWQEWVMIEELRVGVGYGKDREQRIDAYAIRCWGHPVGRVAYEIKTSRSDFLREMKQPRKRKAAQRYATAFYFVAPKGLLKSEEIPPDAGLVEVWRDQYGDLQQHAKIAAPELDGYPPTWAFLASVARRLRNDGGAP